MKVPTGEKIFFELIHLLDMADMANRLEYTSDPMNHARKFICDVVSGQKIMIIVTEIECVLHYKSHGATRSFVVYEANSASERVLQYLHGKNIYI